MYQTETLNSMMENIMGEKKTRHLEETMQVYKNKTSLDEAIQVNMPLSGVLNHNRSVWIAC